MDPVILGIDLSMSGGLGLCLVPPDWDSDFRKCRTDTIFPKKGANQSERLWQLVDGVDRFAVSGGATEFWVEGYAASGARALHYLAEVGGAIRVHLWSYFDAELNVAHISSARKTFLGRLPQGRGVAKKVIQETLRSLSAPFAADNNQCDAFVVANHALSVRGLVFMCAPRTN